jgi:hypothetical protein|tara:strand:- start:13244 stop:13480 length:237 start_codon:yes stop_codon:yes gene_type:complete
MRILCALFILIITGCVGSDIKWSAVGHDNIPFKQASLECEFEATKAPGTAYGLIGRMKYDRIYDACMRFMGFKEELKE